MIKFLTLLQESRPETEINIQIIAPITAWGNATPQIPNLTDADALFRNELDIPSDVIDQHTIIATARGNIDAY